jgi:hypothetical protein
MNVTGLIRDATALAAMEAGREPAGSAIGGEGDEEQRRRLTLERQWSRKLDEVIALTAACEGTSAAGDDRSAETAMLPSRRLRDRAAAAVEELGTLADAITKLDGASDGSCDDHAAALAGGASSIRGPGAAET